MTQPAARFLPCGWCLFALCLASPLQAQETDEREYSLGRLFPKDFAAAVPNPRPEVNDIVLRAYLGYDIRHRFKFRVVPATKASQLNPGSPASKHDQFAVLDRVVLRTVVLPKKSWFLDASDLRLLDHEQGHLDICELLCRDVQKQFDKLIASGGVKVRAANADEAVAALDKEVQRLLHLFADESWTEEQNKYDRETAHGMNYEEQRRWREAIDKRLAAKQ